MTRKTTAEPSVPASKKLRAAPPILPQSIEPTGSGVAAEWVPLSTLRAWARNPRRNEAAIPQVRDSLIRFGWGRPLVVRSANRELIIGHTASAAAAQLAELWADPKYDERCENDASLRKDRWHPEAIRTAETGFVPVRFKDVSESDAHRLAVADNKLGEIAEWDALGLAALLQEFGEQGAAEAGFSAEEFAKLLGGIEPAKGEDDDPLELPPKGKAISRPGEVYELGPHRLICGDSRNPKVWAKLLGKERLHIVWTDPPYGVDYVGKTKEALKIENDALTEEQLLELLRASLGAAAAMCMPGAAWYVASPGGPLFHTFGTVLKELGIWRHTLTWVKDVFVMGRCDYHYKHEPIFYGWEPNGKHYWCGARNFDTVLEFERPKRSTEHPTMKPPELIQHCIRNSSKPGQLVGDGFGGSGSTLIAAAREGRKARLVELDPRYCDVIRRRWTRFAESGGMTPGAGALAAA
ncbi:MAG TPA: DNA methyltransferase [Polyangiaceae bacterium]|nr:DNA methyltransferase [Polyangiaceae bacterium]